MGASRSDAPSWGLRIWCTEMGASRWIFSELKFPAVFYLVVDLPVFVLHSLQRIQCFLLNFIRAINITNTPLYTNTHLPSKMRRSSPPPFWRNFTFKTLLSTVNDFWGYTLKWTGTSVHVNTLFKIDKLKKLLSGGRRGAKDGVQNGPSVDCHPWNTFIFHTILKHNTAVYWEFGLLSQTLVARKSFLKAPEHQVGPPQRRINQCSFFWNVPKHSLYGRKSSHQSADFVMFL